MRTIKRVWRLLKPWPRTCPNCGDAMKKRKQWFMHGFISAWQCYDCFWDTFSEQCENILYADRRIT